MNTKEISLTDKQTGEVITGTLSQVADKIKVNEKTLRRWIQNGHSEKYEFLKTDIKTDILSVSKELKTDIQPKRTLKTDIKDNYENKPRKQPDGRMILDRKPYIKCGQLTYHTLRIDGKIQFICFNSCTDLTKKPIEPFKKHSGATAAIEAILRANEKKINAIN